MVRSASRPASCTGASAPLMVLMKSEVVIGSKGDVVVEIGWRRVGFIMLHSRSAVGTGRRWLGSSAGGCRATNWADANSLNRAALEIDHRGEQFNRMARPVVGIIAIDQRNVVGV